MLFCTCGAYWPLILDWLLPPVAGLLSAIGLWVVHRTRSISEAALSTSLDHEAILSQLLGRPTRSASRLGAPGPRKSYWKRTTSTSPGEAQGTRPIVPEHKP